MNDEEIIQVFKPLWNDIDETEEYYVKKPLLAHYTSIYTFENILKNNELWFSNPLFMNDFEEVNYVFSRGRDLILNSSEIRQELGNNDRINSFCDNFDYYCNEFATKHILDTYVFCLSEHDKNDKDGLLSMWRGYGSNGSGIALVFDAAGIGVIEESPFIISKVKYPTEDILYDWLNDIILKFVAILQSVPISNDDLFKVSYVLFSRIKVASLFAKHNGFKEEREWRIVYFKERDPENKVGSMCDYYIGPNRIEPKLKLKIEPIDGLISSGMSLTNLLERIILGPNISTPLTFATLRMMLDKLGKSELKERINASSIPFRAISRV